MRLTNFKIRNFRGIRSLDLRLERDVTVLIGENNSGKTSILEAMRIGLDIIKSEKMINFSEYDFYRDQSATELEQCNPINLIFQFEETEEYPWDAQITQALNDVIVGDEFQTIKLRITAQFDAEEKLIKQTFGFLDDADNEMQSKQGFLKELKKLRPFFYQSALRAAKDEFQASGSFWSSFLKDKSIAPDIRQQLEADLNAVNRRVVDAHASFKDVTDEVQHLHRLVSVGKADAVSVDPRPADFFQAIRSAEVNLLTAAAAKIPIRSHGEGTQSLSVLLLFSAYLKTRLKADIDRLADPIIAIEEPESHLHPNAIRALWPILRGLPGQKIIATHSGDILSEIPIANLRRLNKENSGCECCELPANCLTPEESRKFNHHVRRNRGELLFARQWLLVEGETDVSVLAECADLLGIDLNAHSIRIVECSQAGGPGIFIKAADALNIGWHLVADNDQGGLGYVDSAKELLNARNEQDYISVLGHENTDILLCCSGYGAPYRAGVGWQKVAELTEPEGSDAYWKQVYKIINKGRFSKPAAALEALMLMRDKGESGVPSEIRGILEKVSSQPEETPHDPA
jgi:putative ATP-dependent endonuclease of OLD family